MSLSSLIVIVVLVLAFAGAVVWIARNGGWQNEGCHGNCAQCRERCENKNSSAPGAPKA